MEEQTSSSTGTAAEPPETGQRATTASAEEHRQAYGTAKTENLRDSGLWRIILPTLVVIFCLALLAIPLFILIPLLSNSIVALSSGNSSEGQLLWVWITMIVLEVILAAIAIRGFWKIFLTQAGNYRSAN
jgi:hypothetical protein